MKNPFRLILVLCMVFLGKEINAQDESVSKILWTCDWSADGKFIATGGNSDTLKIYETKEFKLFRAIPIQGTTTKVKWHPSKNILAVATQLSAVKSCIIDIEYNTTVFLEGISLDGARAIDWNGSGTYLAVGDNDGTVSRYDLKGQLIKQFKQIGTKSITDLDWHPTKEEIIYVSDEIWICDTVGNLVQKIKHRKEDVLILSVAWHKSGDFFVVGDYGDGINRTLLQYWTEDGKMLNVSERSEGEIRNVNWNQKGDRLAVACDKLQIWNKQGKLIAAGKTDGLLWGVSWNPQGNKLVTTDLNSRIIIWNQKAEMLFQLK